MCEFQIIYKFDRLSKNILMICKISFRIAYELKKQFRYSPEKFLVYNFYTKSNSCLIYQ